jgi:hypothetical protein
MGWTSRPHNLKHETDNVPVPAALVVLVLVVMNNQQGLAVYIVRTFLHGGR